MQKKEPESNVLLASVENMQYEVTLDVLHTVSLETVLVAPLLAFCAGLHDSCSNGSLYIHGMRL